MRRTLQPARAINRGIYRNINPSVGEIKKPRSVADQCFRGGEIYLIEAMSTCMREENLYNTGRSVNDETRNIIKHPSTIQSWQDSIISPVFRRVFFSFALINVVSPQCESENNSVPVASHWCDSTSEISSKKVRSGGIVCVVSRGAGRNISVQIRRTRLHLSGVQQAKPSVTHVPALQSRCLLLKVFFATEYWFGSQSFKTIDIRDLQL